MSKLNEYLEMVNNKMVPSIEEHLTFITVDDDYQFEKIKSWSESKNKKFGNIPKRYPVYIDVSGSVVGWQDRADRAANYIKFTDFLNQIGE